jgi:hypothetical protein
MRSTGYGPISHHAVDHTGGEAPAENSRPHTPERLDTKPSFNAEAALLRNAIIEDAGLGE